MHQLDCGQARFVRDLQEGEACIALQRAVIEEMERCGLRDAAAAAHSVLLMLQRSVQSLRAQLR